MNFLKNVFNRNSKPTNDYEAFWKWFTKKNVKFHNVLKKQGDIEGVFFNELGQRLEKLKEGFWFLAGMYDEDTVELILTADGEIKNIVFVEELINAAPQLENWRFTALKPESSIENVSIEMNGYNFNKDNLSFYSLDNKDCPDEIMIRVIYDNYEENDHLDITNGVYLFIDNYLGELVSVTTIDVLEVTSKEKANQDLIPISKLKSFLNWREKEYVEKYDKRRYDSKEDEFSALEAVLENGLPLIAIINDALLNWEFKASHPWVLIVIVKFEGNEKGMPDKETYAYLDTIEDHIVDELKDADGYLNIGRETADSNRIIYFACSEFRRPSKVMYETQQRHIQKTVIDYEIFKDKYWQTFNRFLRK